MAINPMAMLRFFKEKNEFESRHPKAVSFLENEMENIPEGTVIEITLNRPGETPVSANFKMTAEDVKFMGEMKKIKF